MKRGKTIIFVLITLSVIYINIQGIINNLLNKKYIVNEITDSHTEKSLNGIYKAIDLDYNSFRWIILINTIYILILAIYILYVNNKRKMSV
ncbi:hypothetical protein SAMN02927921_00598 [Sinomicrobium oceani]|uniref:Uncharacterized protein n=1 Tax=Sinomicrobium oceani TaxID=1150368 RepID=A0A1K1MDZ2_9FLAO|nr:hypothetical protein SAMN02927921_00598 [Sinomicrobium oceani]